MSAITLTLEVGRDHRLVIQLPPEIPAGPVEVTIVPQASAQNVVTNPAHEAIRAKLQ